MSTPPIGTVPECPMRTCSQPLDHTTPHDGSFLAGGPEGYTSEYAEDPALAPPGADPVPLPPQPTPAVPPTVPTVPPHPATVAQPPQQPVAARPRVGEVHINAVDATVVHPGDQVLVSMVDAYDDPERVQQMIDGLRARFPGVEFTMIMGATVVVRRVQP